MLDPFYFRAHNEVASFNFRFFFVSENDCHIFPPFEQLKNNILRGSYEFGTFTINGQRFVPHSEIKITRGQDGRYFLSSFGNNIVEVRHSYDPNQPIDVLVEMRSNFYYI